MEAFTGQPWNQPTAASQEIGADTILELMQRLSSDELRQIQHHMQSNSIDLADLLSSTMDAKQDSVYARMQISIQQYIPPLLLAVGITGNLISFFFHRQASTNRFSPYFYLMLLAFADLLVLLTGLLPIWLHATFGLSITSYSGVLCKIFLAVNFTLSDFSVWLIVAVTVDRYILVCHALKAKSFRRKTIALYTVIAVLIVLFLIHVHFFWTVEQTLEISDSQGITSKCDFKRQFHKDLAVMWPLVDMMLYSVVPFIILSILNAHMIRHIWSANRWRGRRNGYKQKKNNNDKNGSGDNCCKVQPVNKRLTLMLMYVSVSFFITTLPMTLVGVVSHFLSGHLQPNDKQLIDFLKLLRAVTELLMYTNHTINFFLYCATGRKFREQIVCKLGHKRPSITERVHNAPQIALRQFESKQRARLLSYPIIERSGEIAQRITYL